jgi:hypothetical protein
MHRQIFDRHSTRVPHFSRRLREVGILTSLLTPQVRVPRPSRAFCGRAGILTSEILTFGFSTFSIPFFMKLPRDLTRIRIRFRRDPRNHLAHAAPPAAAHFNVFFMDSIIPCPPTIDFRWIGNEILPDFFFGMGKSATCERHFSQYTPPPPSRTHSPPHRSQYFSSIRTSVLCSSFRRLAMYSSKK